MSNSGSSISTSPSTNLTSRFQDLISLLPCTNLRIIQIALDGYFSLDGENWNILRTISSPHLEKLQIYGFNLVAEEKEQPQADWEEVDDLLCGFYDRSYTGTFEVCLVACNDRWRDVRDRRRFCDYVLRIWSGFSKKGDLISFRLPEPFLI